MKFFCEYCGNRIDAEKDHKCPHCGASYKKNQTFEKLEEEKKQRQKEVAEFGEKIVKHVFDIFAFSKYIILIPTVIFAIVFVLMVASFANKGNREQTIIDNSIEHTDIFNDTDKKEENVVVGFDEFGKTSKYQVKVNKYEVVEDKFNKLSDDYEYVKFYLLVENLTEGEIRKEDVNCIVDGVAQTNDLSSGYSDLPFFIQKGLTVKGTATFEVPVNATGYDIRYGDNVTIHIDK